MKVTLREKEAAKTEKHVVQVEKKKAANQGYKWWAARSKGQMNDEVIATAAFLKDYQQYRYRQAGIFSRLYSNIPLFNWIGSNLSRVGSQSGQLPIDRPTMNVVQSCIDTLISRITQSRPRPVFLTDNGDTHQRTLAKQLNNFIVGELYQTKAYELGALLLRDAAVLGTGCVKIYETDDHKIALERVISTELYIDPNEAMYGQPRQLYQFKLIDRDVLEAMFPESSSAVNNAEQAYPDASGESSRTVSDQVMVVEAWHLPSGKNAKDGKHVISCGSGMLLQEEWDKNYFPFEFLHYCPRLLGFWSQGLAEQIMGTQVEINKLLITISKSINLVGVPRVFVEEGSKVNPASFQNDIGTIIKFRGTKPIYEVAPCVPQEVYAQLQRLVEYAYQQSGVSALAATSQKPAGLNSGEAIRNYDDLQSDRFAALEKRYDNFFVALAYQITNLGKDIAIRDGKYQTVYPNKNGTKQIDLPDAKLLEDPFVIQCFDASSLPRDPAGRLQKVTEMAQSGMISMQEARRLLDYPDLDQVNKLANAGEERILKILDDIVEEGKYTPPDPYMDLQLASQLVTQYYNLYSAAKLAESRAQMLRDFDVQVQDLKKQMMSAMPQASAPQALPEPRPTSPLLPNVPG